MTSAQGRASGPRWNAITARIVQRYWQRVAYFKALLMADGYPPFTTPVPPQEQYQRLIALRDASDPRFWGDPDAQKALATLALQFGPPPPLGRPPLGPAPTQPLPPSEGI